MKNFSYIFGAEILSKLILFSLSPILANTLTSEEYGIVELFLTVYTACSLLVSLGLDSSFSIHLNKSKSLNLVAKNFIWMRIFIALICTLAAILLLIIYQLSTNNFLLYLSAGIFLSSLSQIYYQLKEIFRFKKLFRIYALDQVIASLLLILIYLSISAVHISSLTYIIALSLSIIFSIFFLTFNLEKGQKKYKPIFIKKLINLDFLEYANIIYKHTKDKIENYKVYLKTGMPFYLSGISEFLFQFGDKVIILSKLDLSNLAYLSVAYKPVVLMSLLSAAVFKTIQPKLYNQISNNKLKFYINALTIFSKLSLSIAPLIPLFCYSYIKFLYPPEYEASIYPSIILFSAATIFSYYNPRFSLVAMNEKLGIASPYLMLSSGIINIILCLSLVEKYDIHAASISTFISSIFIIIGLIYFISRYKFLENKSFHRKKIKQIDISIIFYIPLIVILSSLIFKTLLNFDSLSIVIIYITTVFIFSSVLLYSSFRQLKHFE